MLSNMRSRSIHLASSSVVHGGFLFGLGALASLALVLVSAPAWAFYLAPALAIPVGIRAFEAQVGRSQRVDHRISQSH
jgi:hypothetical protein